MIFLQESGLLPDGAPLFVRLVYRFLNKSKKSLLFSADMI